jgi:hypothetical protein
MFFLVLYFGCLNGLSGVFEVEFWCEDGRRGGCERMRLMR